MADFTLQDHGITVADVRRNLMPPKLYAEAIREDAKSVIADSGALIAYSGEKTGRSPKDKRIVRHPRVGKGRLVGNGQHSASTKATFQINLERAKDYLNTRKKLYCVDAFAGWDPQYRLKVRVICARPYHALFMHNMLIRPTRGRAGGLRQAGRRDLQRRPVPGQPADRRA